MGWTAKFYLKFPKSCARRIIKFIIFTILYCICTFHPNNETTTSPVSGFCIIQPDRKVKLKWKPFGTGKNNNSVFSPSLCLYFNSNPTTLTRAQSVLFLFELASVENAFPSWQKGRTEGKRSISESCSSPLAQTIVLREQCTSRKWTPSWRRILDKIS